MGRKCDKLCALVVVALVFAGGSAAVAGQVDLAQPDVSAFPQIQLYVYATGSDGKPIAGASAGEFEVREDGHVAPIEAVRDATRGTPIEVSLVIDRSGSMFEESKMRAAKDAAMLFLRRLRTDDRAALISFADSATLDRSLTRDVEGVAQSVAGLQAYGGTALYDAVYWSVNQVALAPQAQGSVVTRPARSGARRVVLALTDGDDNRSNTTPDRLIQFARANGVTIYTIGLGTDAQASELTRLAEATGGRYFGAPGPQALAQLYALIARQLQSEYALTYSSPNVKADGTRREVAVTLRTPGGTLRATGWYQAPGAGSSVVTVVRPSSPSPGPSVSVTPSGPAAPRSAPPLLWLVAAVVLAAGVVGYLLRQAHARGGAEAELLAEPLSGAPVTERTVLHVNPRIDLRPFWVVSPVTEVGRAEGNHVILDSPLVSRRHARIEKADGEYRLVDVGSANGTYLNGERITEAPLAVGDVIRFADQEFQFAGEQAAT